MDNWIKRRRSDVRFQNELNRVDMYPNTSWYNTGARFNVVHETFSVSSAASAPAEEAPEKKKKKKRKKTTESGNEKSATSTKFTSVEFVICDSRVGQLGAANAIPPRTNAEISVFNAFLACDHGPCKMAAIERKAMRNRGRI